MTIKEVEECTGLARSNIRFYEKEKLIEPSRNESNGYRDYSKADVENIKKIAYLRTLGISIDDIRRVMEKKTALHGLVEKQSRNLEGQITDLKRAKAMCDKMLDAEKLSYEDLKVEQYVTELPEYWKESRPVFQLDSVSFLYLWGGFLTWIVLASVCLIIGILSYGKLPDEIPIQWSNKAAVSLADKKIIFAYPIACVVIRYLLRPFIYARLQMNLHYLEITAEYLTNYLCFVVLTVEAFSILFILGITKNIVTVLFLDTLVLIGLLIIGVRNLNRAAPL